MTAFAAPYVLEDGESRWGMEAAGLEVGLLARGQDTGGRFTFMRYEAPAGFTGPPLHVHRDLDEAMFVLDGRLRVRLGEDDHLADAGAFVWMPREVPHAFVNAGDGPARFIGIVSPPGSMEGFFAAVAEEVAGAEGPPDRDQIMALNAEHGIEVLGPPLSVEGARQPS